MKIESYEIIYLLEPKGIFIAGDGCRAMHIYIKYRGKYGKTCLHKTPGLEFTQHLYLKTIRNYVEDFIKGKAWSTPADKIEGLLLMVSQVELTQAILKLNENDIPI